MKTYILTAFLIGGLAQVLFAQKIIKKSFEASTETVLSLQLKHADRIQVKIWEKPTISFRASVDLSLGKLNDSLDISFASKGERIIIATSMPSQYRNWVSKKDYESSYANEGVVYWKEDNPLVISDLQYEIYIPSYVALEIETINADIEANGLKEQADISTINGYIDTDWDKNAPATITMGTINGEVYSDLEIPFSNFKKNPIVGYKLKGNYLGGGQSLHLKSINGDIFLRARE